MRKFLKSRLFTIIATMLLCFLVFGTMAYASGITKEVSATATVTAGNPYLELYSDTDCATPVTTLAFGNVGRGNTTFPVTYYVKNTGWVDFAAVDMGSNLATATGTIVTDTDNFALPAGAVKPVKISLSLTPSLSIGSAINFKLDMTGN